MHLTLLWFSLSDPVTRSLWPSFLQKRGGGTGSINLNMKLLIIILHNCVWAASHIIARLRNAPTVSDKINVTGCGQGALKNHRAKMVVTLWHCTKRRNE